MPDSGPTGSLTDRRVVLPDLRALRVMSVLNSQHSLLVSSFSSSDFPLLP